MKTVITGATGIKTLLVGVLFVLPAVASAQVKITEIMYDVPGSDAGREWIEVTNIGGDTLSLGKYKLFENNTNHGLTSVMGGVILVPGSSAVIASDAKKFVADWPAFSGILLDSAFDLSNTGETLVIKDASSTVLDTATYSASMGAAGDSGSLHLEGTGFIAALPNPGIYPGALQSVPAKVVPAKTVAAKPAAKTSTKAAPPTTVAKKTTNSARPTSPSNVEPMAALAEVPQVPTLFLWLLGLASIILLGIAGVIFARARPRETLLTADEFNIE